MEFSTQEYWCGLLCSPPWDVPNRGIEPVSPASPALQVDSLLLSHWENPKQTIKMQLFMHMSVDLNSHVPYSVSSGTQF